MKFLAQCYTHRKFLKIVVIVLNGKVVITLSQLCSILYLEINREEKMGEPCVNRNNLSLNRQGK